MASHPKRPHLDLAPETPEQTDSSTSEDENESGSEEDEAGETEIQVEFEARTPEERDLPGIISLLRQCFRNSEVDIAALARWVARTMQ